MSSNTTNYKRSSLGTKKYSKKVRKNDDDRAKADHRRNKYDKRAYVIGGEVRCDERFARKIDILEKQLGVSYDVDDIAKLFGEFSMGPQAFEMPVIDIAKDTYVDVLENVFFLSIVFMRTRDVAVLVSTTMLFAKNYCDASLVGHISDFITKFCFGDMPDFNISQYNISEILSNFTCEEVEPQAYDSSNIIRDFRALRRSPLMEKMNNLLALVISLGFLEPIHFSIEGVKLFCCEGKLKFSESESFIDYVLDLFEFFFKTLRSCFGGERFEFLKDELTKVDEDIIHLQSYINSIALGDYTERTSFSVSHFQNRIMETINTLRYLISTTDSKPHKVFLNGKLAAVSKIMVLYEQCCPLTGLRAAPFSMSIFGKSSVGKTSVAQMLTVSILKANGYPCEDNNLCTLQSNDKFYSTYRADTTAVFIDDIANTKADKAQVNPADMIISLVNNVMYYAPKAVAEEKGKIKVQPNVVTCTTNVKEMESAIWSNEPISVLRRMNVHITVTVKPEYATNGKLDPEKIDQINKTMFQRYGLMDVWYLELETIKPSDIGMANGSEGYVFTPILPFRSPAAKEMFKYWTLPDAMVFLNAMAKRHYNRQSEVVTNMRNLGSKLPIDENGDFCWDLAGNVEEELEEAEKVWHENLRDRVHKKSVELHESLNNTRKKSMAKIKSFCVRNGNKKLSNSDDIDEVFCDAVAGPQSNFEFKYPKKVFIKLLQGYLFGYLQRLLMKMINNGVNKFWDYVCSMDHDFAAIPIVVAHMLKYTYSFLNIVPFTKQEHLVYTRLAEILKIKSHLWLRNKYFIIVLGFVTFINCFLFFSAFRLNFAIRFLFTVVCCHFLVFLFYVFTNRFIIHWYQERLYKCIPGVLIAQVDDTALGKFGKKLLIGGITIAGGLAFVKAARASIRMLQFTMQGNLQPKSDKDVEERDEQVNVWSKKICEFGVSKSSSTFTSEQMLNRLSKNCLHVELLDDKYYRDVSVFMLRSNFVLCPYHFFCKDLNIHNGIMEGVVHNGKSRKGIVTLKFRRSEHSTSYFTADVYVQDIVRVGKHDLCVFRIFNGGTFSDVMPFVLTTGGYSGPIRAVHMRVDGSLRKLNGSTNARETYYAPKGMFSKYVKVSGGIVRYDDITENGMCCGILVSDAKNPTLVGFHIAGLTNSPEGRYVAPLAHELESAMETLVKFDGNLVPHCASEFKQIRFGVDVNFSEDIHPKSPVNFIPEETYRILGSIGTSTTYFSEVRETILCRSVENHFGILNKWGKPQFGPERWRPWFSTLEVLAESNVNFPPQLLKRAKEDYLRPIMKNVRSFAERMRPLTEKEVINGIHGKRFIDSFNFQSGCGFPLRGPKKNLFIGSPGDFEFKDPEMVRLEIEDMRLRYYNKERYYAIFKACLKDEPTKLDKKKVRVFQASCLALQMEWRRLALPLLRLLSLFPLQSECAVGINPFSDEWTQLHNYISFERTCENNVFAGDYSKWDLNLSPDLIAMAFQILIEMAKEIPSYSECDILCLQGLATDTLYYLTHYNGTLIEMCGGVPSGHNLTAHINSICNSLLIRMCYFSLGGSPNFRSIVHLITYGDDFMAGVRDRNVCINHVIYANFCRQFGVVVTMPDKVSEPTPFMDIWKCDFLKRRSIICPYDGKIYGALEVTSLLKSLMNRGKLKISPREHAYAVLMMAQREISYHDEDTYNDFMHNLRLVCVDHCIVTHTAHMNHFEYYAYREDLDMDQELVAISEYIDDDYPIAIEASSMESSTHSVRSALSESLPSCDECDTIYERDTLGTLFSRANPMPRREAVTPPESVDGFEHISDGKEEPHPQSSSFGVDQSEVTLAPLMETGNTVTMDGRASVTHKMPLINQEMLSLRQHESRSLAAYLSRPEVIYRGTFNSDLDPQISIPPLSQFLTTPNMREKIRGYAFLNATLNLKVVVDSSPLVSGAAMVTLHPWRVVDNSLGPMSSSLVSVPSIEQKSQLPHILVDFGLQQGGEISMPIITPANGLDLSTIEPINNCFSMYVNLITRVFKPDSVTAWPVIIVYAWLTDVSLVGTTLSSELPIPQANEFARKPKDIIPTASMSFKDSVKGVSREILGKASDLGINAAFEMIGLSNPNNPEGAIPFVPRLTTNMACSNAPTNIDSLAADIKNEVTLSMEDLGYTESDPMNLDNILSRWGMLGRFLINTGTAPLPFFIIPVSPTGAYMQRSGTQLIFHPPPVAVAALGFSKWRGTLVYKFYAVGSAFLRGKIRIAHDVAGIGNSSLAHFNDAMVTSRLNNVIWDLSMNRCIEIHVPYVSNLPFKNVPLLHESFSPQPVGAGGFTVAGSNGGLILSPFTALSDGTAVNVPIIMSVRGEKGMAFGDLRPVLANYTFAGVNNGTAGVPEPQSALRTIGEDVSDDMDITMPITMVRPVVRAMVEATLDGALQAPLSRRVDLSQIPAGILLNESGDLIVHDDNPTTRAYMVAVGLELLRRQRGEELPAPQSFVTDKNMNSSVLSGDTDGSCLAVNIAGLEDDLEDSDKMILACLGEKFFSIRQIIKRYTMNWTRQVHFQSLHEQYVLRVPDKPIMKGWQGSQSLNLDPGGKRATYARDSFLSFFSVCFLGYRGSLRHKYEIVAPNIPQVHYAVNRTQIGNMVGSFTSTQSVLPNNAASVILMSPDFRSGGLIGNAQVNNVVEFSTPFQCRSKFCWAQDRTPHVIKSSEEGGFDTSSHQITISTIGNSNRFVRINKYIAAGDDFTFMFYLYAPVMVTNNPGLYPVT